MVVELKEYESPNDMTKALESEIGRTKSMLGEYLRRLDEIRTLAERQRKVRNVVTKLAGKKTSQTAPGEITVGDLNIILEASPVDELNAIEEVVKGQQERLLILQKTHDGMKWTQQIEDAEGLKYVVLERDGVPAKILLKIE
jgi:hypothetical protein